MTYTLTRDDAGRDAQLLGSALSVLRDIGGGLNEDAIIRLQSLADSIWEQVKPAIEEPLAFASVVRVKTGSMFVRVGAMERHPWVSGECRRSWDELEVVEVLRVGLEDGRLLTDAEIDQIRDQGIESGGAIVAGRIHNRLLKLLGEAITSERKSALEKAIQAVEELS